MKTVGQLVVVVLARVDQQLLVALAQEPGDGRRLHELRAVPDDRDDRSSGAERSADPSATAADALLVSRANGAELALLDPGEGCTSRSVEARNASATDARSSSVVTRSWAPVTAMTWRRVIEVQDASSSGGVYSCASPSA